MTPADEFTSHVIDILRTSPRVRPVGARTKRGLSATAEGVVALEMSGHRGITEYDPGEFTFTARAGTPLREIAATLAANGQYLPFDPPFVDEGATLGGTIAAGLNGPGRLRFGGIRDFILGLNFVTGDGRPVQGGGKVVKNAAGFDFPKLLVGSCGQLGVILDATFKVFPAPQARLTAEADTGSLAAALQLIDRLSRLPADLDALELEPPDRVIVRLAGNADALQARLDRLGREANTAFLPVGESVWRERAGTMGVKIPLIPTQVPALDTALAHMSVRRWYSVAAQVAWVESGSPDLSGVLGKLGLAGLALHSIPSRLGRWPESGGERLVKRVFDPAGRLSPTPDS